jgi:hypothetical protein
MTMTDATITLDTPTTDIVDAPAKGGKSPKTQASKPLPATLTGPAAPKPSPIRAGALITRVIKAGARLDAAAIVTVLVECPKAPGSKTHARWQASLPAKGGSVPLAKAMKAGYTVGDARYDFERRYVDIEPAPDHIVK